MARVAMLLRIMPADQDVDLNNLIQKIKEGLPTGFELKDVKIKPFAFGMSVIEAMFTLPEAVSYTHLTLPTKRIV